MIEAQLPIEGLHRAITTLLTSGGKSTPLPYLNKSKETLMGKNT
jgi:hypothetical protein